MGGLDDEEPARLEVGALVLVPHLQELRLDVAALSDLEQLNLAACSGSGGLRGLTSCSLGMSWAAIPPLPGLVTLPAQVSLDVASAVVPEVWCCRGLTSLRLSEADLGREHCLIQADLPNLRQLELVWLGFPGGTLLASLVASATGLTSLDLEAEAYEDEERDMLTLPPSMSGLLELRKLRLSIGNGRLEQRSLAALQSLPSLCIVQPAPGPAQHRGAAGRGLDGGPDQPGPHWHSAFQKWFKLFGSACHQSFDSALCTSRVDGETT